MRPNPQFPVDLVTFSEEMLNGKLHLLCSVIQRACLLKWSFFTKIYSFIYLFIEKIRSQL